MRFFRKTGWWWFSFWLLLSVTVKTVHAADNDSLHKQYQQATDTEIKTPLLEELAAAKDMRVFGDILSRFGQSHTVKETERWINLLINYKNPKTVITILEKASRASLRKMDDSRGLME
ncbi:MAG: hypothetical protein ACE5GM_03315, partial [bacterium]